jgi:hypothetical protein
MAMRRKNVELPKGFKAIERLGKFFKGENPGDAVTGKLVSVKTKHFERNGRYPARDAKVYLLDTGGGRNVEVTQSGGLGALELVKKGETVHIVFLGMKKLKGKQAMREYLVGVK